MSVKIKGENICSLCLNVVDTECEVIDEVTRQMIGFLSLKVDLEWNNPSVICKSCAEVTKQSYNFKSVCIEVEKSVRSLHTDENYGNLELKDIHKDRKYVEDNSNVCRLCLKVSQRCDFVTLDVLLEEIVWMADLFSEFIPEVDLNAVKNPLICKGCKRNLLAYLSLIQKFCGVERKVETCSQEKATDDMKLITLGPVDDSLVKIEKQEETPNELLCQDNTNSTNHILLSNEAMKMEEAFDIKIEEGVLNETALENSSAIKDETKIVPVHENILDISKVKRFQCKKCTYETKNYTSLSRHMITHKDNPETYKCALCAYESKHKQDLKQHVLTHKAKLKCTKCTYETKHSAILRRHMKSHKVKITNKIETYKCTTCSYETKYKSGLKTHMIVHKDPSELKMYTCPICQYETKHRSQLNRHVLVHKDTSDIIMYKCTTCEYETEYRHNVLKHILSHDRGSEVGRSYIRLHKCPLCPYTATYKSSFERHMLGHGDMLNHK